MNQRKQRMNQREMRDLLHSTRKRMREIAEIAEMDYLNISYEQTSWEQEGAASPSSSLGKRKALRSTKRN